MVELYGGIAAGLLALVWTARAGRRWWVRTEARDWAARAAEYAERSPPRPTEHDELVVLLMDGALDYYEFEFSVEQLLRRVDEETGSPLTEFDNTRWPMWHGALLFLESDLEENLPARPGSSLRFARRLAHYAGVPIEEAKRIVACADLDQSRADLMEETRRRVQADSDDRFEREMKWAEEVVVKIEEYKRRKPGCPECEGPGVKKVLTTEGAVFMCECGYFQRT